MPAWHISPLKCAGVKDGLPTANLKRQKRRQEAPSRRLFHFELGGLFELVGEGVASAPHRAHGVGLVPPHHCLAQAPDMHIDGTLVDIDVAAPDAVKELRPAEHAARALYEELEQAKLGRPEMYLPAVPRHPVRVTIKLDVANAQYRGDPLGAGAPENLSHPRHQLGQGERLDHVMLRALISDKENGLTTCASAPVVSPLMRSLSSLRAVRRIMGMVRLSLPVLSRGPSSRPERPGSIPPSTRQ